MFAYIDIDRYDLSLKREWTIEEKYIITYGHYYYNKSNILYRRYRKQIVRVRANHVSRIAICDSFSIGRLVSRKLVTS